MLGQCGMQESPNKTADQQKKGLEFRRPDKGAKLGILAALAITILSLYPQLQLWVSRREGLTSAVAYNQGLGDEVAYAAYLNAIIEGRPRRSDPYTGRDHSPEKPQHESLFSIQFVPAYAIGLPARALGISANTVFIILTPLAAFTASLILFSLLQAATGNQFLAAAGTVVVFCLGAFASGEGAVANWISNNAHFDYLPFLRRYQPASAFPLFLLLCLLMWRALNAEKSRALRLSVWVGVVLSLLIYSYFYLWTAAVAWLLILGMLWWVLRPSEGWLVIRLFAVIGSIAAIALIPYLILILRGSEAMTSVQALVLTRKPDLFSVSVMLGTLLVLGLGGAIVRGNINPRDPRVILAASFALLPFVVLNQQLLTGRVMQPIHYKGFVTNYSILIASVLTAGLAWRKRNGQSWKISKRALLWIALAALDWGFIETRHAAVRGFVANDKAAEEMTVYARLRQVASETTGERKNVVLFSDLRMADGAPAASSLPVMWAPHMVVYPGTSLSESKERLYRHLYYNGVRTKDLEDYLFGRKMYYGCAVGLFGFDRFIDGLNPNAKPITAQEKLDELLSYQHYATTFDGARAADPQLAFFVTSTDETTDFSNLDRWYHRDSGEQVGKFILYRLTFKNDAPAQSVRLDSISVQSPSAFTEHR